MIRAVLSSALTIAALQQSSSLPVAKDFEISGDQRAADNASETARLNAYTRCHRDYLKQYYEPDPNLWIVKRGTSSAYIFGVEHVLPVDFAWRSKALNIAIAQSGVLLTETGMPVSDSDVATPERSPLVSGIPIASRLRGRRQAKWEGIAAMLPPAELSRLDGMPSWMVAEALNLIAQRRFGSPVERGPDSQLVSIFTAAGKPVGAIEGQLALKDYLKVLPESAQQRMLNEAVDEVGSPIPWDRALSEKHAWARGGIDPIGLEKLHDRASTAARLIDGLSVSRNVAWADRVQASLSPGVTILVAVGAAHLYGPNSLLTYLRARGLKPTLVSSPTPAPISRSAIYNPVTWRDCNPYLEGANP